MRKDKIAIIGLYMLVCHWQDFATKYPVVGYDINKKRVSELMNGGFNTRGG